MRNVWRQRLPYYTYSGIRQLHDTIKDSTTETQRRELDLINKREAKLLFRVTNFFNPRNILQAGAATGVESFAMMGVSHQSRLFLYDPLLEQKTLALRVLQDHMEREECYDGVNVAVSDFLDKDEEAPKMALINIPVDADVLKQLIDAEAVIVMRHLHDNEEMWGLFENCCEYMTMGQTYTNGKIAILNPNPKLPREDFLLWL